MEFEVHLHREIVRVGQIIAVFYTLSAIIAIEVLVHLFSVIMDPWMLVTHTAMLHCKKKNILHPN